MTKHLNLSTLGPGLLVAATGVGAGDLITASLAGSEVGLVVAVAALVGALLKWTLNEGIARWQMATGTTVLEGWIVHLHPIVQWTFITYFFMWSFVVGGALVNACGVAGASLLPLGSEATSKAVWGVAHSVLALVLVLRGGFKWFESAMAVGVAVLLLASPPSAAAADAAHRSASDVSRWALAVLGGVGGTVTLLSYGYWIADRGRRGAEGLLACRIDLGVGYAMTALFGVSMIVIGSRVAITGQGAGVALDIAGRIGSVLGPVGYGVFLLGFWGAVFSSILGVWQSAPFLFADFLSLRRSRRSGPSGTEVRDTGPAYRGFLIVLALASLVWLWAPVRTVQLVYATLGAGFLPFLAVTLLVMNNRRSWVGELRNGWTINALLAATLLVFSYLGLRGITD
jgi:Mn2+/Fe2+ NRAMP family transporter